MRNEWAAHGHFAQPGLQCDLFQGGVALTPASTGTREGSNPEPAAPSRRGKTSARHSTNDERRCTDAFRDDRVERGRGHHGLW